MRVTREIEKAEAMESTSRLVNLAPAERRKKSGQRGSTIFEFAMVAVITLVIIFGMIDFARALYSYHFVTNAAREAARFASVRGALCSNAVTPCPAQLADIQNFVTAITPLGIDQGQLPPPTVVFSNPNNLPICDSVLDYPGCGVQVTVTYNFNWIFPVNFYSLAPVNFQAGTITMGSTSEMVISR